MGENDKATENLEIKEFVAFIKTDELVEGILNEK